MEKVEYNKLSKKLRQELEWDKPLKPDESVTFELIGKGQVVQKLARLGGNKYESHQTHRASVWIPPTDIIYDPWKNNLSLDDPNYSKGETEEFGCGGNVDIGVPTTWNSARSEWQFETIEFTKGSKGVITISGREPHKRGQVNYLRASNFNRSNRSSNPPRGTGHLFEEIKVQARAKDRIKFEKEKNMAVNHILSMSDADAAMSCKVLNLPIKGSLEENLDQLMNFIITAKGLKQFLGQSNDTRTPVLYVIKKAVDLEMIKYDDTSRIWSYADNKRYLAQVTPGSDPYQHLLDYFFNTKQGEVHREFLETQIAKLDTDDKAADAKKKVDKITKPGKQEKTDEAPVATQ